MNSIIQQIYCGEVYPAEQIISADPEYKPTHLKISKELEQLKKELSQDMIVHLDELERLFLEASSMNSYASFLYGFRLAVQLMHECL